jgi:hypothetical protein
MQIRVLSLNHYGLNIWEQKRATTVQGVGGPQLAKVSAEVLQREDKEDNSGTFHPFMITGLQLYL